MENYSASKVDKFKLLLTLLIAATLSLGVYMYQGHEISLNVDGDIREFVSYAVDVDELIRTEEIKFEEGAYVNYPLEEKIENNMNIIIKNPKSYTIDIAGVMTEVTSVYNTVEEILEDLEIELGEKDYTYPELEDVISPNTTIEIYRVEEVITVEESAIPFEEQITTTNNLEVGVVNIVQEGSEGLRRFHVKDVFVNGELSSSVIVKDEIVEEPKNHIVEKGSRDYILTSRGETRYRRAVVMEATAYDLSFESTGKRPGDRYYGITASGTRARPGAVAVDPKVIPLGTKLYIESLDGTSDYGFAIAEDTGGAIKGNKIDLFFETANQVRRFGRRKVKVYILK